MKPVAVAFRCVALNDIRLHPLLLFHKCRRTVMVAQNVQHCYTHDWGMIVTFQIEWGCRLNLLPDWSVTLSNDIGEKVGGVGNIKLATSQSSQYRCLMILHPAAPPQPGGAAFKCRVILPEACQMDRGCSPPRKYLKLFSNLGFMQLSYEL